jgi:hypothetical protein
VVPLREIKDCEKTILLHTQILLRKHAPVFKKHLLLGALNLKLAKEG